MWAVTVLVMAAAAPGATTSAPAATTSAPAGRADLAPRVAALIDQLGSPDFAAREAAQRELLTIGEPAAAALRRARRYPDAEIVQRAEHILATLQRRRAQHRLAGATCSGAFVKQPVSKVLSAVCRDTGNTFWLPDEAWADGREEPVVTLELDKTPFWEAVDAVCQRANVKPGLHNRQRALSVRAASYARVPTAYAGPFRVTCHRIVLNRDLEEPGSTMLLRLVVAWEPRLAPIQLAVDRRPDQATDDLGHDLVPPDAEGQVRCPVGDSTSIAQRVDLRLVAPPRRATSVRTLRGSFSVVVPARFTTVVFKRLGADAAQTQARDDVTVGLVGFRREEGGQWIVSIDIRYDLPGDEHESYQNWHQANQCRLRRKKDGKRISPGGGYNTTVRREGHAGFEYIFTDVPGDPGQYELEYRLPTLILRPRVSYQFRDLPLP